MSSSDRRREPRDRRVGRSVGLDNNEMADAELSALLEQRAQLKIAETVGRKNGRAAAWYEERPAEQRFVGLLNQGATCYLNSLLQAMYMTPDFKHALQQCTASELPALPRALCQLFSELQVS